MSEVSEVVRGSSDIISVVLSVSYEGMSEVRGESRSLYIKIIRIETQISFYF